MNKAIDTIFPKGIVKFLLLVIATTVITYVQISILVTIWSAVLLVLYAQSDDEPFWLAFFLVTVDGFMGFLGLYSVTIKLIPGLPAIELAQFYVVITLFKAARNKQRGNPFYLKYLQILLIYLIFLIAWGFALGFSGELNAYFRILKSALPLALFYSIPKLFTEFKSYDRFFGFIFLVLILGFCAQIFTILTGISPANAIVLSEEYLEEEESFRTFYNTASALLGLFGALLYLSIKRKSPFNTVYLYSVVFSAYGMAFLSATRGWILAFSLVIAFSFLFTGKIDLKRFSGFFLIACIFVFAGLSNNKIRTQITFAKERVMVLETITEGDVTAEGTLQRISERSPKVMKKWSERPIFGWGNSNIAREYADGHVGNQNLLMTTGIVGFSLLIGFFLYFTYKLSVVYFGTRYFFYLRNTIPIFAIFLAGWFIIHSTSGQQFSYGGMPLQIIPQVIFFSMGALVYSKSKKVKYA